MATRVIPSARLRHELDEKLAGIEGSADPLEEVARRGARLVLQQAIEDEVTEYLGRGRYERTGAPVAYRDGYEPTTVKATAGPIALERPRLRSTAGVRFESRLVGRGVARSHAPETLTICSFLRGLRSATSRPPWRRPSRSGWSRSRPSRGSARTPARATAPSAGGGSTGTTSSTSTSTPAT